MICTTTSTTTSTTTTETKKNGVVGKLAKRRADIHFEHRNL